MARVPVIVSFEHGVVGVVSGNLPARKLDAIEAAIRMLRAHQTVDGVVIYDRRDSDVGGMFERMGVREIRFVFLDRVALIVQDCFTVDDPAQRPDRALSLGSFLARKYAAATVGKLESDLQARRFRLRKLCNVLLPQDGAGCGRVFAPMQDGAAAESVSGFSPK